MLESGTDRLLVVDADGKPAGLLTLAHASELLRT
jgi:hypothetical protein